jgi:hypothetical protein
MAKLPPPLARSAFESAMLTIWRECRASIYVLLDHSGTLVHFMPFADAHHKNDWGGQAVFEPPGLSAFLRVAAIRFGREEVIRDPQRWWTNGALICNVMPPGVWGESMLPELHDLVRSAAACAVPSLRVQGSSLHQRVVPSLCHDYGLAEHPRTGAGAFATSTRGSGSRRGDCAAEARQQRWPMDAQQLADVQQAVAAGEPATSAAGGRRERRHCQATVACLVQAEAPTDQPEDEEEDAAATGASAAAGGRAPKEQRRAGKKRPRGARRADHREQPDFRDGRHA